MKLRDDEPVLVDEQRFFEQFMSLIGQEVEVGLRSIESIVKGRVTSAMFDSFLIATSQGTRVIRFEDVSFLDSSHKFRGN